MRSRIGGWYGKSWRNINIYQNDEKELKNPQSQVVSIFVHVPVVLESDFSVSSADMLMLIMIDHAL